MNVKQLIQKLNQVDQYAEVVFELRPGSMKDFDVFQKASGLKRFVDGVEVGHQPNVVTIVNSPGPEKPMTEKQKREAELIKASNHERKVKLYAIEAGITYEEAHAALLPDPVVDNSITDLDVLVSDPPELA